MRTISASALTAILAVVLPTAALSQTRPAPSVFESPKWTIELGVEARAFPRWEGSDDLRYLPFPVFDLRSAGSPRTFRSPRDGASFGLVDTGNFRMGPVGKLVTPRKADDDSKLAGLGDVDWGLEIGLFAEYWVAPWLRTRAELRHAIGAHRGLVGDVMIDGVWEVTPQLTLSLGPRMSFGNARSVQAYYGINPVQSALSGLPVYNADGGIHGVGGGVQVRYEWTHQWATFAYAEYERLVGTVADSPLVALRGSRDQWTLGAGITYTFNMDRPW